MSRKHPSSANMVATKSKKKALSCSTPEPQPDSPSRDSDSICGSDAASPVPFLCTQDGAEGETDVVWNYYTPKSENALRARQRNSTPLSRKAKKNFNKTKPEKEIPKRRNLRSSNKKTEFYQELVELNENIHELISKKSNKSVKESSLPTSEEDVFSDLDVSPKSGLKSSSHSLRKNLLTSKFCKPEPDTALESDDSMNECLLRASQVVEENLKLKPITPERNCHNANSSSNYSSNVKKKDSPLIRKTKKSDLSSLNNDTFDNLVGNLNDSALEMLTQMPIKNSMANGRSNNDSTDWTIKELVVHDSISSPKAGFSRHSSMPESPSVMEVRKPSTSGTAFSRYSSMPYDKHAVGNSAPGDSPIRCTPEEIKKKRQQAREKLMAKRLLPFTQSSQNLLSHSSHPTQKKKQFQPKVASNKVSNSVNNVQAETSKTNDQDTELKLLIEKKRQEALMRLRRRQPQNKMP